MPWDKTYCQPSRKALVATQVGLCLLIVKLILSLVQFAMGSNWYKVFFPETEQLHPEKVLENTIPWSLVD